MKKYKGTQTVEVKNRPIHLKGSDSITLYVGDKHTLEVDSDTVDPELVESITWEVTEGNDVVEVSEGKITALKTGDARSKAQLEDDDKYYVGRTYMDIPDEDGLVFIPKTKSHLENTWIRCKITEVKDYDLIGKLI